MNSDFRNNFRPLLEHENENSEMDEEEPQNPEDRSYVSVTENEKLSQPVDRYHITYIVFYLIGMTTLLPWNFFITAEEYWQYKFRNLTSNNSDVLTPRQLQFQPDLAVCSAIPSTIFLILNAFLSHKISLKLRIMGSIAVMLVLFVITTIFVKVNTDAWQNIFFAITLITVFVVNIFSAILSGSIFGISGQFSAKYITAVVSGQALGGVFSAGAEVLSITFSSSPTKSGFIFFLVGTCVLMVSLLAYWSMSQTLFFKYHTTKKPNQGISSINADTDVLTSTTATTIATVNRHYLQPDFAVILNKIWQYGFSEWLVFVTTLAIYPAITILVTPQNKGSKSPWSDIYFVPVVNYLLFNFGDYVGRILAGWLKKPLKQPKLIAAFTLARMAFLPAFLLCNITQKHPLPVLIHSDWIFITMMAFFAVSNGYIANICLLAIPDLVDDHEKEMASSMMAAFLGIGLTCGSAISFILIQFVS